jgi:Glycosyltransferase family 87
MTSGRESGSSLTEPLLLRIPGRRLRLWAIGLAVMGLAPILGAVAFGYHDWPAFWSAGATAGTADLVDPIRHLAWQRQNGLPEAFFPYPAGAAWLFAPFSAVSLGLSFGIHAVLMLLAIGAAGWIAAPLVGVERRTAVLALAAFAPVTASVVLGQNAAFGLLLATVAIAGLVRGNALATGLAIGLLLYKPTYALPLVGLLLLRRRWTELAIVAAAIPAWYLLGVAAAGGDPAWPAAWLAGLGDYLEADFAGNADKAVSLPGLVARLDVLPILPILVSAAIVLVSLPRLATAPILEAAVAACLVGVAASPHAWGYDAALVAPFLLWLIAGHGRLREPIRTPLIVAVYVGSLLWLVSRQTVVSAVALVVLVLFVAWVIGWTSGIGSRRVLA